MCLGAARLVERQSFFGGDRCFACWTAIMILQDEMNLRIGNEVEWQDLRRAIYCSTSRSGSSVDTEGHLTHLHHRSPPCIWHSDSRTPLSAWRTRTMKLPGRRFVVSCCAESNQWLQYRRCILQRKEEKTMLLQQPVRISFHISERSRGSIADGRYLLQGRVSSSRKRSDHSGSFLPPSLSLDILANSLKKEN